MHGPHSAVVDYPTVVRTLLENAGAGVGDRVRARRADAVHEGVVMPHHGFSGDDILTLKLDTGYNVGVAVDGLTLELLAKGEAPSKTAPPPTGGGDRAVVAFLGTGGTIASFVDYRTGAVHPAVTAEDLLFSVPELAGICRCRARVLYSVYSENVGPGHWTELANEAVAELNRDAVGVIIPHGTDTLGYTAAALSFLLRDLPGPVVLVGSQRSSDRPSSDAAMNLLCAAQVARADLGEVVAVMHTGTGDETCTVHRGTKVRKMHTSRRDAFRSINVGALGAATADAAQLGDVRPRSAGPARVEGALDPDVALVQFHPGLRPEWLERTLEPLHGLVIAGTGLGHVAADLLPVLRKATGAGKPVVMASQSLHGRVGLYVYDTGRDLLDAGVIPAADMLPETALVKLMWVLGSTRDPDAVRQRMEENLVGEINPRIELGDYE